ncbi:MAG: hypothetical protein ACOC1V_07605 [Candidatus Saliniplasma sp.]
MNYYFIIISGEEKGQSFRATHYESLRPIQSEKTYMKPTAKERNILELFEWALQ